MTRGFVHRALALTLVIAAGRVLWTVSSYYLAGRTGRHRVEAAWFVVAAVALAAVAVSSRGHRREGGHLAMPTAGCTPLLLAFAASFILYWPAIRIGLLSDDYVLLARPASAVLDSFAWEHFRPLPLLAWKAIYPVGGPAALHILNIALHALNGWIVWRLAIRIGQSLRVATLVAVVFLFFPAAVEPVVWNSGIFDVAAVFFGLLYLHGAIASTAGMQSLGLAALVAAMLSKETAVILPAVALAVAVALGNQINRRTLVISIALAGGYTLLRVQAGTAIANAVLPAGDSVRYALKEAMVRPFATLGAPWTAAELSGHPIVLGILPVATMLALICIHAFEPRARLRPLTTLLWVLLGIAPLAGFFFVSDDLQGSRYLYLPLCGWSLLAGDLVSRLETRRLGVVAVYALVAASVGLGFWGVRQHLEPWTRAADSRDHLLAQARSTLLDARCSSATFEDVPTDYGGAHLFRNGFAEAVGVSSFVREGAVCRFVWDGARFVRP